MDETSNGKVGVHPTLALSPDPGSLAILSVVVTGIGLVSALGGSLEASWQN